MGTPSGLADSDESAGLSHDADDTDVALSYDSNDDSRQSAAITYDVAGRLERIWQGGVLVSAYEHDANGNRTRVEDLVASTVVTLT